MKKRVAVIGVTGAVGQEFVLALNNHPWFEVKQIAASERSAKKKFVEAIRDPNSGILKWHLREPIPEYVKDMIIESVDDIKSENLDLVFSSVESEAARDIESKFAQDIPVISTSAAYRYEADVPILIPGINDDHVALLDQQKKNRGWKGFVAPLPNCTTTGLAITMKPLLDKFGAQKIIMTSMQAMSGAGRSPGVSALDITDNIIPYIPKEEDKVRLETGKILGKLIDGKIDPAKMKVSCTCTRVPVIDGHTETVFVEMASHTDPENVKKAMQEFSSKISVTGLPSAPKDYLLVHEDPTRPQPRLDREINDGMTTVVGRIREDTVFDNGIKYVLFSHNEKMGSAKGAVLLAEMLYKKGYI
ncbi:Aspartate-semialdehyde dehydrogenase [Candidatus Nitrosotalea sp. TS]|uniref:aspartate-semialdehyde dehydrogenase n=1 Tax=Candidatus Nitrosotalea sp. TS TaxID=2341020 RepID=UPI00140B4F28|nr:aspartate-semialdehyde dehydrogenase [Candidatus Nitrosotalea sp. TS]NHI04204.1 Aspartate-semialdehyde dehydrogenase [Candidatus Nitrosotalea sp. TS]